MIIAVNTSIKKYRRKGGRKTKVAYNRRLIQSGQVIEIIEYERLIVKDLLKQERKPGSDLGRAAEASEEDKERHREDTLSRARQDIRRLINSNVYQYPDEDGKVYRPVFLTLTFADNVTELNQANKLFRCFIKNLSFKVFGKQSGLQYVVVPEIQHKREQKYGVAVWHYHLVIFNLPYIPAKELELTWQQGFIKINAIDQVDNVGAYVVKYMNKDREDERLRGKKCYSSSRGLFKPKEIRCRSGTESVKEKELNRMAADLAHCQVYQVTHQSDNYGSITYKQYNMTRLGNQEI